MDFPPLSGATHLSASFYPNSAEVPSPEPNVMCRLEAATEIPELAVEYTGELFDALCDAYDADVFGVSLPRPETWAASKQGVGVLSGFELLPVVGSDPVARLAEMIAHPTAALDETGKSAAIGESAQLRETEHPTGRQQLLPLSVILSQSRALIASAVP